MSCVEGVCTSAESVFIRCMYLGRLICTGTDWNVQC